MSHRFRFVYYHAPLFYLKCTFIILNKLSQAIFLGEFTCFHRFIFVYSLRPVSYPEAVSAKIEAAYQAEKEVERLNGKYSVHFADLRQFQTLDKDKQRPIKRMLQETSKVPWRIGIRPKEVPDIWPGETKRKATRAVPSDDDRDEDYVEAKTRKSKKASSKT
eukprot:TRINITY_DN2490_c0_g1_i2.p1 TRINITY_DN2490_c0_g1~~TRINITY_DN2490_c0_g1_i2.p1  ORF type:complete len:162 (+),score=11.92 TRINITY_DN2490_c0_g1_i2:251-736(+)